MRKVFTLLLMSIITSIGVWAEEEATASAKFIVSDDGKTLTVSGKGDLTTLNITMNMGKIFTNVAAGNVFSDDNGTSVTEGSAYNSSNTYYVSSYTYSPTSVTVPTAWTVPFGNVTTTNKWMEDKLVNLYSGYYSSWNTSIVLHSKVTAGSSIDLRSADAQNCPDKSNYFIYTGEGFTGDKTIAVSNLKTENVTWLTLEELREYYTTETKYKIIEDNIFVSTDDGNTFDERPKSDTEYTYNTGEVFYKRSVTYVAIEDNTTYFETNPSYITDKNETNSFVNLLNAKILERATVATATGVTNTFEKVCFVNEDRSTQLIINDDIVHAILFPTVVWDAYTTSKEKNNSIETLDLGEATIENLTSNAFIRKDNNNQLANMTNLTLPLTKKTSEYNESSKQDEEKMVLPTQVLEHYSNYTPGKGSANLVTVTIPEGYDRLAKMAFYSNAQITTFNLPSSLKLIGESAFENCGALTSITLNEGLENIGKRAFVGTNLTEISFPHSLRIINDAAFAGLKIMDLKFNAGLKYIGNSAFALTEEMTVKTIEIPASVKYIGPFAFNFRQYQDVFFLGADAPIMPIGNSAYQTGWTDGTAFSAHTLMGNNGFHPGTGQAPTVTNMMDDAKNGYANRENYKNGSYYFCILHFPTGLTDEKRAKYTDITRVYKTHRDAKGNFYYAQSENPDSYETVGSETTSLSFGGLTANTKVCYGYEDTYLGSQYIWPSQQQWNRSYAVNSNGYNWDGVTKYRPTLSDEDLKVLAYAGYKKVTDEHPSTGDGYYTMDELQKIAHMGTRQFVLTNADTKKDVKPEEEPVYPISVTGSNWWTICVPFNMTKAQVDEVFGKDTHVCRFSSVTRTDDGNGNKSITLRFQNDVYATKWTRDAETLAYNKESGSPADNDIVIYSHEAYMIYPTKSSEDANGMYNIKDYKLETGSPLPTIIKANAGKETEDHTEYRFVGNYVTEVSTGTATNADAGVATAAYETVTIPQYSYIYAKKKNDAAYKFWFFTGTQMAWSPNKCVVQATARDGGAQDYSNFFGGNANNSKVSQVSLFGEDGTVTEIENVTIIAGEGENAQIVYNLNGQVVSSNGNTDRLAKGVYIKGGKKFMVK
ncbi:MAG: leucine-rich repeat domain-containing protein [Prevotella sp.]|nr:leucine-rich repeat domain-containing protein [Prevotella sp.]